MAAPKVSRPVLFSLLLVAVFLLLNWGAYTGYFQDDDMNSLAWTRWAPTSEYLNVTLTPVLGKSFRTVGFYFYHAGERIFRLDFPKYIAVIHAIHLLSVWILWLLLRRLGSPPLPAAAACFFFALHMALFEIVWQPVFVFDLLCGLFCFLSILLWVRGDWIFSFLAFWLAYKSKEVAVMLPLVLVCYELWFGRRRWLKLAPFLAASLSFGLQALFLHPVQDADYIFHFTADALAATAPFYASQVFLIPYAGFLLPLGAVFARNHRTWFGLSMMFLFFFPLLWLPGRVVAAYCYVPFGGLAIAMAGMAEPVKPPMIAAFFVLWFPMDIQRLGVRREEVLRQDRDAREWILTVGRFARTGPPVTAFVYKDKPEGFRPFGVEGTLKYFYEVLEIKLCEFGSPEAAELLRKEDTALLSWDGAKHRLDIQTPIRIAARRSD